MRINEHISSKLRFFGRAIQDEVPQNFSLGLFDGKANYPLIVNAAVDARGENVVGNLTYTISLRFVNEAEVAYSQGKIVSVLGGVASSPAVLSQLTNNAAYPDPYGCIPSVSFTGGNIVGVTQGSAPYNERNLDRTFFDNFSATLGNHSVRTGFTISQLLKTENASSGNPSFQFNTWSRMLSRIRH